MCLSPKAFNSDLLEFELTKSSANILSEGRQNNRDMFDKFKIFIRDEVYLCIGRNQTWKYFLDCFNSGSFCQLVLQSFDQHLPTPESPSKVFPLIQFLLVGVSPIYCGKLHRDFYYIRFYATFEFGLLKLLRRWTNLLQVFSFSLSVKYQCFTAK